MADYRQMWENLGMDLEKHDALCEVLPQDAGGGLQGIEQEAPWLPW